VVVRTIEVRRLEREDLDRVTGALRSRSAERHRRRFEAQERGGSTELIAWRDGEPAGAVGIGYGACQSPEDLVESRGFASVSDLFVEEPHRRHGVARALMMALERDARAAGMPGVILDTGAGDDFAAARALYTSMGYVDQGGVYLGGWSDPDRPDTHIVDRLTIWVKTF
jgi:GNAT superfamily N-acetyltransferase